MKPILLFLIVWFLKSTAYASPVPATSSSSLITGKKGIYHSQVGYQISAEGTDWELSPLPTESKYLLTLYRSPESFKNVQASLSVRLDHIRKNQKLKSYVKKWIKQYPRFGFEILGAKGFKSQGKEGYVVDLINRENSKQLRQVVFLKDTAAIVLTCRDHIDNFRNSLKNCNHIIRTFQWTDTAPQELTE